MTIKKILRGKKSILLLFIVIIIIILHYINILNPIENIIIRAISPLQILSFGLVSNINKLDIIKKLNIDLIAKNIELENEYKKMLAENLRLKEDLNEIRSYSNQLKFFSSQKYNFETASIIGKDLISESSYLIVNKGRNQGIKLGQPVIAEEGICIGKTIEINDTISKVILLTDNNSHTAATFQNREKTFGIISGDHGIGMKMELIPQDEVIQINDIVITSGLDEYIPSGLIIGQVIKINKDSSNFFQIAYIQPIISYNSLRRVTILKTY